MKILKYIAVLYVILKVVIFLVGVIPVFLINFSMEYPKEWYEMLLKINSSGRNGSRQFDTISDYVNYKEKLTT
jgi:hypothetical protein